MMTITGWKVSRLGYYLKQLAKELQVALVAEYEFWFNDYEQPLSFQQFEADHFSNFAMKHKGLISSGKENVFYKMRLMCRSRERATLYETKMADHDGVKNFMDTFDCEVINTE